MPTTTSTDGVTVDYLHLGGEGPRLLLVHATGFCSTVWRPVVASLADRFSCWALDVRGHGRSNPPADEAYDWEGTADDVLAVLDDLGGDEPWVGAGHSMGGASLVLAEERRPGTFAGLWAYEPVIFPGSVDAPPPDHHPGNHLADAAERRRPTFPSRQAAFDNYSSKPPMDVFTTAALEGYLERGLVDDPEPDAPAGSVRLACEPAVEAQVYRMGGRHAAWARLGGVAAPTTIVVGDTSIPGPALFAAEVATALPRGRLESHPDLGHFGPMQDPGRIAGSIATALGAG